MSWGPIAIGLSEDSRNSFDWTVDAARGTCYLGAVVRDHSATDTAYTSTVLAVEDFHLIASETVDGAVISIYDVNPANGLSTRVRNYDDVFLL